MRTLIIITALAFGLTARGQTNLSGNLSNLVAIPWAVNPTNSTDYSRTNLPAWWDGGTNYLNWAGGTNYARGVNTWMAWQAANHNWRLLAEYVSTNTASVANLLAVLTNQIDTVGYVKIANGQVVFAEDGTLSTACGVSWADTGIITAGGFNTLFGTINLLVDGSANFGNGGLSIGTAGQLAAAQYRFATNSPPSGVTIGTTAPDFWAQVYSADGSAMGWTAVWTNH
jgi:hypothetical protein